MARKHSVSTDARMNPELKEEVQGLRGSMLGQAEKHEIPERFTVVPHPDRPALIITDSTTGRSTTVPLFAYGAIREALGDLFN